MGATRDYSVDDLMAAGLPKQVVVDAMEAAYNHLDYLEVKGYKRATIP